MNRRCAEEGMNDERKEKLEEEIYDAKATIEEYMLINEGYQSEIGTTPGCANLKAITSGIFSVLEQLQKQPLKVIDSNKP